MNIHQLLEQGEGVSLGPVTIKRAWPMKTLASGKQQLYLAIRDDSAESGITIWGKAAETRVSEGDEITITASGPNSKITKTEWQGKVGLNANLCSIRVAGKTSESKIGSAYEQPGKTESSVKLSKDEIVAIFVEVANDMKSGLMANGWTEEGAERAAAQAPANIALWWFGQKSI